MTLRYKPVHFESKFAFDKTIPVIKLKLFHYLEEYLQTIVLLVHLS